LEAPLVGVTQDRVLGRRATGAQSKGALGPADDLVPPATQWAYGRTCVVVDGYVRVSQVRGRKGPSFISPIEQREQIVGWAKINGAEVLEVFEELDESGTRRDRPLLMRALERVWSVESRMV
jgi:hypothetical protein